MIQAEPQRVRPGEQTWWPWCQDLERLTLEAEHGEPSNKWNPSLQCRWACCCCTAGQRNTRLIQTVRIGGAPTGCADARAVYARRQGRACLPTPAAISACCQALAHLPAQVKACIQQAAYCSACMCQALAASAAAKTMPASNTAGNDNLIRVSSLNSMLNKGQGCQARVADLLHGGGEMETGCRGGGGWMTIGPRGKPRQPMDCGGKL